MIECNGQSWATGTYRKYAYKALSLGFPLPHRGFALYPPQSPGGREGAVRTPAQTGVQLLHASHTALTQKNDFISLSCRLLTGRWRTPVAQLLCGFGE